MKPLLLLHGAIGASDQLLPLKSELEKDFSDVRVFDFPGHGGNESPAEGFSIPVFAESVLEWMDENNIPVCDIFGYSMGGYVALYLARHYPERTGKIMTLATKFAWSEEIAAKEVQMLDPGKIAEKVPAFAKALEKRHAPNDWKEVLEQTAKLMRGLGKKTALTDEDFSRIKNKVLLSLGDSDKMVTREETQHVQQLLPGSSFELLEATAHPIEQAPVLKISEQAKLFF